MSKQELNPTDPRVDPARNRTGLATLILLEIGSTVLAGLSYWSSLRRLRRGKTPVLRQWPLSLRVAFLFAVIGLAGLWALFVR
jgi:hypothetical protein